MADTRPTVWVSQPLIDAAIAPLRDRVQLRSTDAVTAWSPEQVAEQLDGVDGAIITLNERIGAAQVADAAQLQVIANVGVGYNNLDVDALVVAEASVGKSITMKRFHTRGRGKSTRILKPISRLRIVVRELAETGEEA